MTLTNGQSFWTEHFSADEFGERQLKEKGIYFVLCERMVIYMKMKNKIDFLIICIVPV